MSLIDLLQGIGKFIRFILMLVLEIGPVNSSDSESHSSSRVKKGNSDYISLFLIFMAIATISVIAITIWLFIL